MSEHPSHPSTVVALRQQFVQRAALDAAALELALQQFESGPSSANEIESLRRTAHRLVGGLGMFGFAEASAEAEIFGELTTQADRNPDLIVRTGRGLSRTLRSLSL